MTGRTRYGELLHDASRHILTSSAAVERDRFADRSAAGQAVAAWRDLLHALNRHGQQLFGSETRVTGLRATRNAHPREIAALRLVDELAAIGRRTPDDGRQPASTAAAGWAAAAASVRTASDLLATHRDADGGWRSPHAHTLDNPAVRAVGFAELAALVVPTAEGAAHLGLRVGQAGVAWKDVEQLVPQTRTMLDAALEVRSGADTLEASAALASSEVARPAVRTGDPVVELGDRLTRLHRMAWQLTCETYVGVGTLGDFAAAAVLVHEHGGRLMHHALGSEADIPASPSERLREAGVAWRLVHLHSRQLRTATPPMLGVRGDVLSIRHLLEHLAGQAEGEQPHATPRRLEPVIFGGARAFTDVARWNAAVLDHLASSGQLYVPGRLLTGEEVTDDPTLVQVKLAGRITRVTKERMDHLQAAYEAARRPANLHDGRTAYASLSSLAHTEEPSIQ